MSVLACEWVPIIGRIPVRSDTRWCSDVGRVDERHRGVGGRRLRAVRCDAVVKSMDSDHHRAVDDGWLDHVG